MVKNLRIVNYITIVTAVCLWVFAFRDIFLDIEVESGELNRAGYYANVLYHLTLVIFAVVIVFKARPSQANLVFSLFFLAVGINPTVESFSPFMEDYSFKVLEAVRLGLTTILLFVALQHFPKSITAASIANALPNRKFLHVFLGLTIKTWFIIVLAFVCVVGLLPPFKWIYTCAYLFIQLAILVYLFVNYRISNASDRNKVLWIIWGITSYTFIYVILLIFHAFNDQASALVDNILSIACIAIFLFAVAMSLFFFDTFDTGVLVKRTLINSILFILIILVYNTAEHYFLHWLSHVLHLSDVLVASVFSGILVMIISPMHHKIMHIVEKKIKKENKPH